MSPSKNIIFNRYHVEDEISSDNTFRTIRARDTQKNERFVFVALLHSPWLENNSLITDITKHFEILQRIKLKCLPQILLVAKNRYDGFGVVFEHPLGERISNITDVSSQIPEAEFVGRLCEIIHAVNRWRIFHGHLNRHDIWFSADGLQLTGFGYGVLVKHGWKSDTVEMAPEASSEKIVDARTDVFAVARLISECYPSLKDNAHILKALDENIEKRYQNVREMQIALLDSLNCTNTGVRVKRSNIIPKPGESIVDHELDGTVIFENSADQGSGCFKNKDFYFFSQDEFEIESLDPKSLLDAIDKDYLKNKLRNITSINSVLNRLLTVTNFYNIWQKSDVYLAANADIEKLISYTEDSRGKPFTVLHTNQQSNIVLLNRLLFQNLYTKKCPKLISYIIRRPKNSFFQRLRNILSWLKHSFLNIIYKVTRRKWLVSTAIASSVIIAGIFTYTFFMSTKFDLPMVSITVGEYETLPHIKRYFGESGPEVVRVEESFSIQTNEVTVGEFRKFVSTLSSDVKKSIGELWNKVTYPDSRPVDSVSREAALAYAKWISKKNGYTMQLPTVNQWMAATAIYGEDNPVLTSENSSPSLIKRTFNKAENLIGNHREWSSEKCGDGKYSLLGEDYSSKSSQIGMRPCVRQKDTYPAVGFRLVRVD